MTISVVPWEDPEQSVILYTYAENPYSYGWWTNQVISNIPNDSVGWLVAQGWQITNITYDNTTQPPTPYYAMARQSLQNWIILQSLLESWTTAYNTANANNTWRYNDVIRDWTDMLTSSQTQFDSQITEQNAYVTLYLGNLDTYMTEVTDLLDALPTDYAAHAILARGFLTGLGTTDLARINEEFAATLATQLQQLVDKGTYSSQLATDITARNTRDRSERISQLNDQLNREKLDNQHKLYEQQVSYKHRIITDLMNTKVARLSGLDKTHSDNQRLLAYQLDERNKLLIGLYSFVERREDVAPPFQNLVEICTGLGDAGGGWVTP